MRGGGAPTSANGVTPPRIRPIPRTNGHSRTNRHRSEPGGQLKVADLESDLGYRFQNVDLLLQALTHRSAINEDRQLSSLDSYERMEFLGDSALNLAAAEALYLRFPQMDEGEMTNVRKDLVSLTALGTMAESIGLYRYVVVGSGLDLTKKRNQKGVAGRSFEAIVGAIFLDSEYGLDQVKRVLSPFFEDLLIANQHVRGWPTRERVRPGRRDRPDGDANDRDRPDGDANDRDRPPALDHKSRLQQFTQGEFRLQPRYEVISTRGPAHAPTFSVAVILDGRRLATASGKTMRGAEQTAAGRSLRGLERELRSSSHRR